MSFTKILGSGISTETNLHVGVLSATKFIGDGSELLNITSGVGIQSGGSSVGSGITSLNFIGVGNTFALRGDVLDISISSGSNGIVGINTAGISTFNNLDVGGINASGVVTASSFDGNLTGNADTATYATSANTATYATSAGIATNAQGLTGSPNIVVESVTGTTASFSGNVSIGGTLTYEDVTNIDSVGLITARSGINVSAGGIDVTGVSAFAGITTVTGPTLFSKQLSVTGFSTFHAGRFAIDQYLGFGNPGSFGHGELRIRKRTNTQGIIQNQTGDFIIDNQVDSSSNYIRLQGKNTAIEGRYGGQTIAKFIDGGSVELNHNGSKKLETTSNGVTITGNISASGGTNAIGIQSGGQNISTGIITALNFVGAGNSLSVNGSTVDISISGGGGGGSSIAASIALSSFLR